MNSLSCNSARNIDCLPLFNNLKNLICRTSSCPEVLYDMTVCKIFSWLNIKCHEWSFIGISGTKPL